MQQRGERQNLLIIERWSLWNLPPKTREGDRLLISSEDTCIGQKSQGAKPPQRVHSAGARPAPGASPGLGTRGHPATAPGLPCPERRWKWASRFARDPLRGKIPKPQVELMQSPLGERMQSNADPIASVMREGSAGSKISSGNIAPLICGHRWLRINYL